MAEDHGLLTNAAAAATLHRNTMTSTEEAEGVSLEEILRLYGQPINEEQAWAVCFQSCSALAAGHRSRRSGSASAATAAAAAAAAAPRKISGPGDVWIHKDGSVRVHHHSCEGKYSPCTTAESAMDIPGLNLSQQEYYPYVYYKIDCNLLDFKV